MLEEVAKRIGAQGVSHDDRVVNIQMIPTSEIAVSCVIEDKYTELAVRALHETFELGRDRPTQ